VQLPPGLKLLSHIRNGFVCHCLRRCAVVDNVRVALLARLRLAEEIADVLVFSLLQ
jgi:hypothetical protein